MVNDENRNVVLLSSSKTSGRSWIGARLINYFDLLQITVTSYFSDIPMKVYICFPASTPKAVSLSLAPPMSGWARSTRQAKDIQVHSSLRDKNAPPTQGVGYVHPWQLLATH